MDLLQNLLGGGQQRQQYQDFVNRYDRGAPYEGISGEEAYERYHQVAPQLPPDVYQDAARDAFSQMSPQERMQFGQMLQQQSRQQNVGFPDLNRDGIDDRFQDPNFLAQLTGRMHQQQPGLLEQLLGGGAAGGLMGGGAAGGLMGMAQQMLGGGTQQQMGGRQPQGGQNLLDNPLAKAALAGIAAMAVKRMMGGGNQGGGGPFGGISM